MYIVVFPLQFVFAGLVAGILVRKLGERRSLLLGSFLATAGFFSGGFVRSLPALVVCVGIVAGKALNAFTQQGSVAVNGLRKQLNPSNP